MNSSDLRIQLIEIFQFEVVQRSKLLSTVFLTLRWNKGTETFRSGKIFSRECWLDMGLCPLI